MPRSFPADSLLFWFSKNQRDLPWRRNYDPYFVWVSEVMLQQTRMDQAVPYFDRFVKQFPSVKSLANAPEQEILKCWEGLGYYSRARNLHKAAKIVLEKHNSQLPNEYLALRDLPGFGPYIAAAVASIAFNRDFAVVDGNVFRVLGRFFGLSLDIRVPRSRREFQSVADEIFPAGNARNFNQALMELGALVCVPDAPLCGQCPLRKNCFAFLNQKQSVFPVVSKKPFRPIKNFVAVRIQSEDSVWLVRQAGRLLNGLYSFPLVEYDPLSDSKEIIEEKFKNAFGVQVVLGKEVGSVRHDYTHFRQVAILFDAFFANADSTSSVRFFSAKQVSELPLTKLQHKLVALNPLQ